MGREKLSYFLILIPLILLVFGQVMSKTGAMYPFINVFIILGYLALIARGIVWIFILKKLPISFAYPFMSLSFVLILIVSNYLFNEVISFNKIAGSFLIIIGVASIAVGKVNVDRANKDVSVEEGE